MTCGGPEPGPFDMAAIIVIGALLLAVVWVCGWAAWAVLTDVL